MTKTYSEVEIGRMPSPTRKNEDIVVRIVTNKAGVKLVDFRVFYDVVNPSPRGFRLDIDSAKDFVELIMNLGIAIEGVDLTQ